MRLAHFLALTFAASSALNAFVNFKFYTTSLGMVCEYIGWLSASLAFRGITDESSAKHGLHGYFCLSSCNSARNVSNTPPTLVLITDGVRLLARSALQE